MKPLHLSRPAWLLLVMVILAGCAAAAPGPIRPEPPQLRIAPGNAQLLIEAVPAGAQVTVDGAAQGSSPLTLTLSAGAHQIALAATGYAAFSETITLDAGREAMYAPELADIAPPTVKLDVNLPRAPWLGQTHVRAVAADNAGVVDIELALNDLVLAAVEAAEISFDFTPATTPGVEPGHTYTLTATATDAAGNIGQTWLPLTVGVQEANTATPSLSRTATPTQNGRATASPTATRAAPSPIPTPAPARPPAVSFRESEITIPTYPYQPFLRTAADPALGDYPVLTLDRPAYEAATPRPAPAVYTLLVLENRYLRLSILPELGGRIYEVIFKPTGNNELYRNPVIKPTQWGPPNPPYPAGANWWLAVGGIEWGFPVEEHGYDWGKEWGYDSARLADGGVTVSLFTGDTARPYATVNVTLAPDAAYFTVQPTLVNPTAKSARVKWWANALLAPGAANKPGPELRFIFPVHEMTIHSTGDPTLPGPGQPLTWPIYENRDLSRLGNWGQYLGFFERPAAATGAASFMGVYDTAVDEGMLRIYPGDVARGAKGFGMGWRAAIGAESWTDDDSGYVELHGGLAPTFADGYDLPTGGQISWRETWYPVADIGGVTYATATAALYLASDAGRLRISLFPTVPVRGEIRVVLPGAAPITRPADISPAQPFSETFPLSAGRGDALVTLTDARGQVIFEYRGAVGAQ